MTTVDTAATAPAATVDHASAIAGLALQAQRLADDARVDVLSKLAHNLDELGQVNAVGATTAMAPWEPNAWASWAPGDDTAPVWLRVGSYREARSGAALPLPATIPFIGNDASVVLVHDTPAQYGAAMSMLGSMMFRLVVTLPNNSRFLMFDPGGMTFGMTALLEDRVETSATPDSDLTELLALVERRAIHLLDDAHPNLESLPLERRLDEPYIFVIVAEPPTTSIARIVLHAIAKDGPPVGVYVIAAIDRRRMDGFDGSSNLDWSADADNYRSCVPDRRVRRELAVEIVPDQPPQPFLAETITTRVRNAAATEIAPLKWSDCAGLVEASWWSGSADVAVSAPIGRRANGTPLELTFGETGTSGGGIAADHGCVVGMVGSGRSTLIDSLICSLAIRYSPTELSLVLADAESDFAAYHLLPHASSVLTRTTDGLWADVIDHLLKEADRREAMFVTTAVNDFTEYRRRGQPVGPLARMLVIVTAPLPSSALAAVLDRGRRTGIHVLVVSTPDALDAVTDGKQLIVNLSMTDVDVAVHTNIGPFGRTLVRRYCTEPGRVVLNTGGDDEHYVAGRVAALGSISRNALVQELSRRSTTSASMLQRGSTPRSLVDGLSEPRVVSRPAALDNLNPRVVSGWIGRAQALMDHLNVEFTRRSGDNMAIVAPQAAIRSSLTVNLIATIATHSPRTGFQIATAGTADPGLVELRRLLHDNGSTTIAADSADTCGVMVRAWIAELDRRIRLDDASVDPPQLLALIDGDRVPSLLRTPDAFGTIDSPLSLGLRRLLTQGPTVGLHVLLVSESVRQLHDVVADSAVFDLFRLRAAGRLADHESYQLLRSPAATRLADGHAVLADHRVLSTFSPYRVDIADLRRLFAPRVGWGAPT